MTQLYDYLDNELRLGDKVLFAVPCLHGTLYKGRIIAFTQKSIIIQPYWKKHGIEVDGKSAFDKSEWKRRIAFDRVPFEVLKLEKEWD